jgi:hypothetical protein
MASAVPRQPGAGYLEGYQATVLAIKAHEAILKNQKVELPPTSLNWLRTVFVE